MTIDSTKNRQEEHVQTGKIVKCVLQLTHNSIEILKTYRHMLAPPSEL